MIRVVCETEDAANEVMAKTIVINNPTKFSQVKKIKFAVKNLYYEVSITFANKDLADALKEGWSMKFLNKTFRIFSNILTKEKHNHRFKYVLKLTNLPKRTNGRDLLEIVTCTRAKAVFVPKNCFSQNYEKERFARFYFNSIDNMNAVKENHFAFNNKGLYFADKNALTCHVCDSINYKVRNCPENSQLKCRYSQQTAYQDIYKRYKVEAPKRKFSFKPIFPSAKDDFISSDMNWADDWDVKYSAKPTPPVSYAKVIQRSLKNIPSNIPQSQGIKQFEQRLYNLEKRFDKNVDSNVNSRLEKVEQQLNKFNDLIKKFNDKIVNLEMHMLNQSSNKPDLDLNFSPVTDSFINVFNKRVRTDEDVNDIDDSATLQDFYYDATEYNQDPTV
ncbi:hypothetical protein RclHR1_01040017 [Rhizophagus clarus]|uniref:Uncharacterized protein n=1 Tax=Rhizophagus clarus TaxID=94130 RepID=A0A2Z6Q613_9GLOM|nr:hypothetical protein RclHR1_01040017 [Rhizophagus clarus]